MPLLEGPKAVSLPKPTPSSAALVTGASAGIGSEIARLLAARGHNLVLVARRKERLVALADELSEQHGVRAETIACDLGKAAPRGKLPGQIDELGLDVEILVNNAGFATGGAFYEADPERELEQIRVLVEAPVVLVRMFSPAMVQRGRGGILNVASTAGMQPMPYSAGYSAAKAYVLTFS
jgi:short-subunit dehydrogenase